MKSEAVQELYLQGAKAKSLSNREMLDQRRDEFSRYKRLGRLIFAKSVGAVGLGLAQVQLGASEFIGNGGEQIVFAKENVVMKVQINTIGYSKNELDNLELESNTTEKLCQSFLADHWLKTTYSVENIGIAQKAIVARQPKVDGLIGFENMEGLANFTKEFPEFKTEVAKLTAGIRRLHHFSGLYPDILGPENILLTERQDSHLGLLIVDTVPVNTARQTEPSLEDSTKTRREMIQEKLDLLYAASRP